MSIRNCPAHQGVESFVGLGIRLDGVDFTLNLRDVAPLCVDTISPRTLQSAFKRGISWQKPLCGVKISRQIKLGKQGVLGIPLGAALSAVAMAAEGGRAWLK